MHLRSPFKLALALILGLTLTGGCDKLGLGKKKSDDRASAEDDETEDSDDDDDKDKKSKDKKGKKDGDAPSGPVQPAPKVDWKDEDTVKVGGAEGTFLLNDKLELGLALHPTPKGSKLSSAGKEFVGKIDKGQVRVEIDVAESLGKLSPEEAFNYKTKWKSGAKFTFALAGHEPVDIEAPGISPNYGLKRALETVKNRPVLFGKEPDAPVKEHSIVFLSGLTPKVFGPAKTLTEIDLVAVHEDLPGRPGKKCDGFKDSKGGGVRSLPIEMVDRDFIVYERKTSKEIARKKFAAPEKCPTFAIGETAKTHPPDAPVEAWLRTERTKK